MNRLFGCLTIAYCCLIFGLSSVEGPDIEFQWISAYDLVCHAVLYAGLGWFAAMTLRAGPNPLTGWRVWVGPIVFVAVYGVTDEFHQSFVQGRFCTLSDWMADITGGVCVQFVFPLKNRMGQWLRSSSQ